MIKLKNSLLIIVMKIITFFRSVISRVLRLLGIKIKRTILPVVPFKELLPSIDVDPIEKKDTNGNITLTELVVISQLIKNRKPKSIFEIGTFDGRTTLNLANFSPDDALVYTLDLPKSNIDDAKFGIEEGDRKYVEKETIGERFKKNPTKITQLYGDSAVFDFSPYYGKIDFMFVDGSHSAPYAKSDTEQAFKMVKNGGLILWHDYGVWRGVTKVLNDYYKNDKRFINIKHIEGTCFVILEVW